MFPMKSREPALLSLALLVFSPPLVAQRLELANDLTQAGVIEEMVVVAEALLATLDDPARQSREEMMGARTDHLRLSIDYDGRRDWSYWPRLQDGLLLSLNVTLVAGDISVTPSFLGATPAEIPSGFMAGLRTLRAEEDLGRELVRSLDEAHRDLAVISDRAPRDIFSGHLNAEEFRLKERADWDAWRETLKPMGVGVADLDAWQRNLVQRIIDEVVTTYRPEIATEYLKTIDIGELSFAWMGSLERRSPHYYRLQGGDFVFEYENFQGDGNHIHTVWHSLTGDFGDDLLAEHWRASHR